MIHLPAKPLMRDGVLGELGSGSAPGDELARDLSGVAVKDGTPPQRRRPAPLLR